jgi:two-component system, OmpR family, sensor kinase
LTAIQANLELLLRTPALSNDEKLEMIEHANRESHRLSRVVADLLALARADAGIEIRREPVELERILMDAFAAARSRDDAQRISVDRLEPAIVHGDSERLQQMLLILLDNALKYTPSEGSVSVELVRESGTALVMVRDTGVGIDPEDLPHVFERFYRADPARSRDPGGTGLGLPIAHWIAGQHGGSIELESNPGSGTTAIVRLPLAERFSPDT